MQAHHVAPIRLTSIAIGCLVLGPTIVLAQQGLERVPAASTEQAPVLVGVVTLTAPVPTAVAPAVSAPTAPAAPSRSAHVGLLTSYAALQALDTASTLMALKNGSGREANPLMSPFTSRPAAFIALKSVTTISTAVLLHKLSKRHPRAAVLFTAALDGVSAAILANNLRHVR